MKQINLCKFAGVVSICIGINFHILNILHGDVNYVLKAIAVFLILIGAILLSIEEVKE